MPSDKFQKIVFFLVIPAKAGIQSKRHGRGIVLSRRRRGALDSRSRGNDNIACQGGEGMNRKQRRVAKSQESSKPQVQLHSRIYTFEEANALAVQEFNSGNLGRRSSRYIYYRPARRNLSGCITIAASPCRQ